MTESFFEPMQRRFLRLAEHAATRREHLDFWLFVCFGLPLLMAPLSTAGVSIGGGLFLGLYIASGHWRGWRQAAARPWFWPVLALIAINVLGLLWTEDQRRGWELISKLNYFLFALAGATLPWTLRRFRMAVRFFLAGLLLNALVGLLQWLDLFPWRPMDPGVGPIGYANWIFLSLALTNAVLWLLYDMRRQIVLPRGVNIALALVFFVQLISTGGRTGQYAFVLLVPLALWLLYRGRWRLWAMGAALLVVGALLLSPEVQQRAHEGLDNLRQYEAGQVATSWGQRLVFWDGGLRMVMRHPLLGVGTGDYPLEMQRLQSAHRIPGLPGRSYNDNPHNTYLAYLVNFGLPGLAILLCFLWALLKESWPLRMQPAAWFKLSYLAIFLFGSLVDTLIWGHASAFELVLIAAIPPVLPDTGA